MDSQSSDVLTEVSKNPLLCPMCHDYFVEPCLLQCYHTFCGRCLRGREQDGRIVCPLCGTRGSLHLAVSLRSLSLTDHPSLEHMILRYLSQGASMQTVAWAYHVARCTVSIVIRETCAAIWEVLFPVYLRTPSVNDFRRIEEGFRYTWQFPNCVGALDGKHVTIQAPKKSGSEFFNYKKTFSIVLMATCDADFNFTMVDIGAFGSQSDGGIFSNSTFGRSLQNGDINLPMEKPLPGTDIVVPHFLVADEAFPLKPYIMRPYPGISLDREKRVYNYRLSRARRTIENTFGILASRWRIFRTNIIAEVDTVEKIVAAAVCLHNFIRKEELQVSRARRRYCPAGFSDSYDDAGNVLQGEWRNQINGNRMQRIGRLGSNYSARDTAQIREKLKEYFSSEGGSVPWQWRHISRGSQPTD